MTRGGGQRVRSHIASVDFPQPVGPVKNTREASAGAEGLAEGEEGVSVVGGDNFELVEPGASDGASGGDGERGGAVWSEGGEEGNRVVDELVDASWVLTDRDLEQGKRSSEQNR